ncbi:peroxidase [Klebsormidium nitens]|uniref:Peroxidase n=1 Tax=Klebsormidium nitens TaxID=105231 RepID=A0A1Y1HR75_KLENI|nr:peroxidase [Klebsormidium nitens]|eukprot:GAQ79679.1 peroxidase [Klebsormidium nitens]
MQAAGWRDKGVAFEVVASDSVSCEGRNWLSQPAGTKGKFRHDMGTEKETVARRRHRMKTNTWVCSALGLLLATLSLLCLLTTQVTGAELTHEQLFKFAPLPDGALPDEHVYTPGVRECIFQIIRKNLLTMSLKDERINAKFLRLIFHDCAAGGCNGSIMRTEEHNGTANEFLTGFDEVRMVKAAIDTSCNVSISLADTIIAGGVEGVKETGGPDITAYVRFGRRDTDDRDDPNKLPLPFVSTDELVRVFAPLGLNVEDLVALSGAHTIGKATCKNIVARLGTDPTADPAFLFSLLPRCTALATQQLDLDAKTPEVFDKYYFQGLKEKKAMLQTDQELYESEATHPYVLEYVANQTMFFRRFQASLLRLSMVGIMPDRLSPPIEHRDDINFTVPIEASFTLFRPSALVRNNIYTLQAELNQQLATPNTSAVVTSVLDDVSVPGQSVVRFWIVPLPLYHKRSGIPYDELITVLAGLNQTAVDPSKLQLDDTFFGPPQNFQVVSFPINTTFPVSSGGPDVSAYVTEPLDFANFTLQRRPASQRDLFASQISAALRVRPSESLSVSLQSPSEVQTVVTLSVRQTGSVDFVAARVAELQSAAAAALDRGLLFSPAIFGFAEGSQAARDAEQPPTVAPGPIASIASIASPSQASNATSAEGDDTSAEEEDTSALRDVASEKHSGVKEVNFTFGIMAVLVGLGGAAAFVLHWRATRAAAQKKQPEESGEGEQEPLRREMDDLSKTRST